MLDGDGRIRSLAGVVDEIAGATLGPAGLARLRALDVAKLPVVEGSPRLGPCVGGVGKFVCIGLNYADHAAESGLKVPPEPVIFMKATSAICGPNDPVEIPRGCGEDRLGGRARRRDRLRRPAISTEADAMEHVAGYCVVNDVSERAFQAERSGQWTKGKSHDTFGPIGPWLVTRDEVADPQDLAMWLEVDGHRYPERLDPHHGLQGAVPDQLPVPVHQPAAGRRDLDRHAAGGRHGPEAAACTCDPARPCGSASTGSGSRPR